MRDGPATRVEDRAQREADHQRWADDGGHIPDSQLDTPTPAPLMLPVRLVYLRSTERHPVVPGAISITTAALTR